MYQCLKCGRVFRYKRQVTDHLSCVHKVQQIKTPEIFFVEFSMRRRVIWI